MNCKCGGETKAHKVIRKKQVVGTFERCIACGRVEKSQKLKDFLLLNESFDRVEKY